MAANFGDPAFKATLVRSAPALGIVLILAAVVVLIDVAVVAYFSTMIIAWTAIVAGVFEILIAVFRRPRVRPIARTITGLFYVGFGFAFLEHAEFRSVLFMYLLAFTLIASGIVRLAIGLRRQPGSVWFLVSGGVGVIAGLAMLLNSIETNDRAIGLLLGVDLLVHGLAWLMWGRTTHGAADDYQAA